MWLRRGDSKAIFFVCVEGKYSSNAVAECVSVWLSTAASLEEEIIGCAVRGHARQSSFGVAADVWMWSWSWIDEVRSFLPQLGGDVGMYRTSDIP